MSRCFPFPSPGLARNWANGQNLVESTKQERDIADLKKALKKEKKERKEKRKEKKEKDGKSRKAIDDGYGSVGHKDGQQKHHYSSKEIIDLTEQAERSGLTEEHEQPQNLCYLSDGTQSNKRKREESPAAVESCSQGRPLKIRFVFKKSKEPEAAFANENPVCSTSGSEHSSTPIEKLAQDTRTTGVASSSLSERPSCSRENDGSAVPIEKGQKKHKSSKEARYEALFTDWVPPVVSFVLDGCADDDDEDWLFGTKKQDNLVAVKGAKAGEDLMNVSLSCGGASWPRAQFLPDVGIHSLPYTIPF